MALQIFESVGHDMSEKEVPMIRHLFF
jgi:hypothetical protein